MIPRRVLMNADTVGGVWTYALELIRALSPYGVKVALATLGGTLSDAQREELAHIDNVDLFESAYRLEWMQDPWSDVERSGDWLLRLEEEVRPDVVHLNTFAHGSLPFSAPKVVVGHSCVASWFHAVKGEETPPEWSRYRREVARGLAEADAVVAPSRTMLGALVRHHGLRAGSCILNGRDPQRFSPVAKEPFVLAVGRLWDEAKNIATLARAAPRLDFPVYVAGSDRSPDGAHRPLPGVHHLGTLAHEQLASWMSRAAVYALPARYEPFGLSVLEAALSGCALVLGDIPSLREVWGDTALFVPPDDESALAQAISGLLANPAQREHLAARARARARELTPARMAARYVALYEDLIDRREGASHARRDVLSLDIL